MLPKYEAVELPLLQMIHDLGGDVPPGALYRPLANRLGLSDDERKEPIAEGSAHRKWDRAVRWVRQNLVNKGLLRSGERGIWSLTEKGERLVNAQEGTVLTVYEIIGQNGDVMGRAVWGCAESVADSIKDGTVNLCLTSPPYPLSKSMEYGNVTESNYVDWFIPVGKKIYQKLTPDGSFVLNLAPVWKPGVPVLSLYIHKLIIALCEEVGFHLAQEQYAFNQGKLPSSCWVTVRRERVKNSLENVLWFSKSPHPKANNRNVLEPYSDQYKHVLAKGGYGAYTRPSGHVIDHFNRDNGGKIPHNLLVANSSTSDGYLRFVKEHGFPIHPCRFPNNLVEFWLKFTTEVNDLVWDPFCGTNKVGEACVSQMRRFIAGDRSLAYLMGSAGRFKKDLRWRPEFNYPF